MSDDSFEHLEHNAKDKSLNLRLSPISEQPPGLDISNKYIRRIPFSNKMKVARAKLRYKLKRNPSYINNFDKTRTIFIRIPKNASNSIIKLYYNGDKSLPHYSSEYFRHAIPERFRNYLVFAVMRNPIERFESAFLYYKFKSQIPAEREFMDNEMSFLKSVEDMMAWMDDFDDLSDIRIMKWHHFRKQKDFICDMHGNINIDIAFPIEDMTLGLAEISKYTGINGELPKENVNSSHVSAGKFTKKLFNYYEEDLNIWNEIYNRKLVYFT